MYNQAMKNHGWHWLWLGFFWFLAFLFALQKINLPTADLGRHLTNGRLLWTKQHLVKTNLYSFTMPTKAVVNHHWLSGLTFYLIFQAVGFSGLSLFYAGLMASALTLAFWVGLRFETKFKPEQKTLNWWPALLWALLLLPIYSLRTEIRPEGFSLLLASLELWWLQSIRRQKKYDWWWLLVFAGLQVLWVNLHLFFVISWILIGAAWLEALLNKRQKQSLFLAKLLATVVAASLLNPFFFQGLIEPFLIWRGFGYRLAENQTLIFMIKRFGQLKYWHGLLMSLGGVTLASLGFIQARKTQNRPYFATILLLGFASGAILINRLAPFAALILLALGTPLIIKAWKKLFSPKLTAALAPFATMLVLFLLLLQTNSYLSPFGIQSGAGLLPQAEAAVQFFQAQNLTGPIFNNYDLGGYLIYELYPQEKVFVDNRPEAYNPEFFKKYIAAQEDETAWQELLTKHQFQTIFFYRRDFTPWAQPFLIKRLKDPAWVPVYVDNFNLILVRDSEVNQEMIKEQRLPDEVFEVN